MQHSKQTKAIKQSLATGSRKRRYNRRGRRTVQEGGYDRKHGLELGTRVSPSNEALTSATTAQSKCAPNSLLLIDLFWAMFAHLYECGDERSANKITGEA